MRRRRHVWGIEELEAHTQINFFNPTMLVISNPLLFCNGCFSLCLSVSLCLCRSPPNQVQDRHTYSHTGLHTHTHTHTLCNVTHSCTVCCIYLNPRPARKHKGQSEPLARLNTRREVFEVCVALKMSPTSPQSPVSAVKTAFRCKISPLLILWRCPC